MKTVASLPLYEELINNFESRIQLEIDVFSDKRKDGIESFKRLGFPTRRNEDWKYTGVSTFLNDQFNTVDFLDAQVDEDDLKQFCIPEMDCYKFVVLNGKLFHHDEELPSFIKLKSINEVNDDSRVERKFGSVTNIDSPFAALNTALFSDGFYLEIEAGAILEKPLHIIHLFKTLESAFVQPRNLIVIGKGASISIIESYISETNQVKLFINNLVEVIANENSFVDHYILETLKSGSRLVNQTDVSVARSCVYNNYTFSLPGAEFIRNNLNVNLDSSSTEAH
ncbi:MAG: SufD family Fe-S cluster assembly protein, partial [Ferruginibacter sp.]